MDKIGKNSPYEIKYKETLQDIVQFDVVDIKPTGRKGRPVALKNLPYIRLYTTKRPVTKEKKLDMIDILPFIPPVHHPFFFQLNTSDNVDEDIGPLPFYEEEIIDEPNNADE